MDANKFPQQGSTVNVAIMTLQTTPSIVAHVHMVTSSNLVN